jgi:hypothetical protein
VSRQPPGQRATPAGSTLLRPTLPPRALTALEGWPPEANPWWLSLQPRLSPPHHTPPHPKPTPPNPTPRQERRHKRGDNPAAAAGRNRAAEQMQPGAGAGACSRMPHPSAHARRGNRESPLPHTSLLLSSARPTSPPPKGFRAVRPGEERDGLDHQELPRRQGGNVTPCTCLPRRTPTAALLPPVVWFAPVPRLNPITPPRTPKLQEYLLRVNFNLPSVEAEEEVRQALASAALMQPTRPGCVHIH